MSKSRLFPQQDEFSPADAAAMLQRVHPRQRAVNPTTVAAYRKAMRSDRWEGAVSTPLTFTGPVRDSMVTNGVHRLTALLGMPPEFRVTLSYVEDVPVELTFMLDAGKPRSLAVDIAYRTDAIRDTKTAASILAVLMGYDGINPMRYTGSPRTEEAVELAIANAEHLDKAARLAVKIADGERCRGGAVTASTVGALLVLTRDHPDAEQFWSDYANPAHPGDNDPRGALRSYYLLPANEPKRGSRGHNDVQSLFANLCAAWNAHVTGNRWQPWEPAKADTYPHPIHATLLPTPGADS